MNGEIVVVTRSLPFHRTGGMPIAAWDLATALARLGHRVRVLTTSIPDRAADFKEQGVHVIALANTPPARYSRRWRRALSHYFQQNCLDTTHAVLSVSAGAFSLLDFKQQRPDIIFALQAHGTSWGECVSKWRSHRPRALATSVKNLANLSLDVLTFRRFDTLIAVGPKVYKDLTQAPIGWFTQGMRIRHIDNGIDTEVFHPDHTDRAETRREYGIVVDDDVIITACRLHSQKGVDTALNTFASLCYKRPRAVYVIAGDGPERPRLEALADQLGIMEQTIFTGSVERDVLARLYRAADVFLFLSSHVEVGLPLNTLEALASGLPCVVSEHLALDDMPELATCAAHDVNTAADETEKLLRLATAKRQSHLPTRYTLEHSAKAYATELT